MEFDLKNNLRRGNFIMSKRDMKKAFDVFPNLIITFVSKKHDPKENLFGIRYDDYYDDYCFFMHFVENDEIDDELRNEFKDQVLPKIIEFLGDLEHQKGFYVKHDNGKLLVRKY